MQEEAPALDRLAVADRRLNEIYTALRKSLNEAGKQALKREETDWLKKRDALTDTKARLEFVRQRIAELERRIADKPTVPAH